VKAKALVVVVLMLLLGIGMAQGTSRVPKFQVGLDTVILGWPSVDAKGGVVSTLGINVGLGVAYRSYFEPLYPEKGSAYWEVGTIVLLDPYVGVGYDYRINEQFYVGGGVNVFPLHLVGFSFLGGSLGTGLGILYSVFPNIHLGMFLY